MSYHVAIVRTPESEGGIREDELHPVLVSKLGFTLDAEQDAGSYQATKNVNGEDVVLFYSDGEIWAKNPSSVALALMIDLASAFGNGARVRGDEGETYKSVDETFQHPHDIAREAEEPTIYWGYWVPRIIKAVLAVSFLYVFGKLALRYFGVV